MSHVLAEMPLLSPTAVNALLMAAEALAYFSVLAVLFRARNDENGLKPLRRARR